jgi:hypothetical protein
MFDGGRVDLQLYLLFIRLPAFIRRSQAASLTKTFSNSSSEMMRIPPVEDLNNNPDLTLKSSHSHESHQQPLLSDYR